MSDMTTTPISEPVTSGFKLLTAEGGPAPTIIAEWRRLGSFLKRPSLEVGSQDQGALTVLARVYALDFAIMAMLVGLAAALVAAGVELPETALADMEFTPWIIFAVVVGAPVMEEIAFRSWLSGRLGHWVGLALLTVGGLGFTLATMGQAGDDIVLSIAGLALGVSAPLIALIAFVRGTRAAPIGWFSKTFPFWFWFSTLAFALVHIWNFDIGSSLGSFLVLLPLVLPQFSLGMMLGYVRVRFALWAAILLHAAHNATALTLAALSGQLS
jgi:membrane protease YdiL (CAAX protease family)